MKINKLLRHDTDINYMTKNKWTTLHLACNSGKYNIAKLLLNRNANTEIKNSENDTWVDTSENDTCMDKSENAWISQNDLNIKI